MLRCPKCNRTYQDDMQKFCTHDGGRLVPDFEQPRPFDPNATVHADLSNLDIPATPPQPSPPPPRQPDLNKTIAGGPPPPLAPPAQPTTGFRTPDTGPTNFPETTRLDQPPAMQPPPPQNYPPPQSPQEFRTIAAPPPPPTRPTGNIPTSTSGFPPPTTGAPNPSAGYPNQSAGFPTSSAGAPSSSAGLPSQSAGYPTSSAPLPNQSAALPSPSAQLPTAPASAPLSTELKKSKLGLILGLVGILLLLILAAGGTGAYFYFKRSQPAETHKDGVTVNPTLESNTNANAQPTATPETIGQKPEAPPNSVKFENSKASLDGKLAEHYVDFYFYYPQAWQKNPKAGVPGAANFVEVMRMAGDQMQEDLTVSWYDSKGTVEADLAGKLPSLIKDASANLEQNIADYQKVSEGKTTINGIEGYEFRFKGTSYQGNSQIWGRIVYLPPGDVQSNKGVTLYMLTTSLAPELKSVDDVGAKGEMPVILNSFTLGKS